MNESGNKTATNKRRRWAFCILCFFGLGYSLAAYLLIWGLSDQPPAKIASQTEKTTVATKVSLHDPQLPDEDYVQGVLAREQELVAAKELARRASPAGLSSRRIHSQWQARVQELQQEIAQFTEFPEGSVQWHLQQTLEKMQEDQPQR